MRPNQAGRATWPRLLRVLKSTNVSVHDIMLVDGPSFHLVVNEVTNAEIYRITIRGGNQGGLDGVDISGTNYYVHHVEVTNR
jgi:rhamnogalacturonan hydrolase